MYVLYMAINKCFKCSIQYTFIVTPASSWHKFKSPPQTKTANLGRISPLSVSPNELKLVPYLSRGSLLAWERNGSASQPASLPRLPCTLTETGINIAPYSILIIKSFHTLGQLSHLFSNLFSKHNCNTNKIRTNTMQLIFGVHYFVLVC